MSSEIKVDTISENTSANGVAIDGLTIKEPTPTLAPIEDTGDPETADTDSPEMLRDKGIL